MYSGLLRVVPSLRGKRTSKSLLPRHLIGSEKEGPRHIVLSATTMIMRLAALDL
jgi:hypothetical protein